MTTFCPHCAKAMTEVKTACNYGIPILIDQCPDCGGLWFDEDELYRTRHGAAKEVEKEIDLPKLAAASGMKKAELLCPRDRSVLTPLADPYFADRVEVKVCPACQGFWFNSGGFAAFQAERTRRVEAIKNRIKDDEDKEKTSELEQKIQSQVIALMNLYAGQERQRQQEKQKSMVETAVYVAWMMLRLLLFKK